jgi:hypothetical protein
MKRLSWSKYFNLTALLSLGLVTTVASVNGASVTISGPIADRSPQTVQEIGARVPAVSPGTNLFKAWEGFQTTNFLSTEQYLFSPPLASVAAGPTNIITIVNRRIAMFDNPNAIIANAPGASTTAGTVGLPTQMRVVPGPGQYPPSNEALLDAFLGEAVLRNLCPSGFNQAGGTTISCLIENEVVRYDQMQGKWIIAMTVTDTGVISLGNPVTANRKASWVVLVSKFSTFPTFGTAGSSDVFITPTPPIGSTSGPNATNWFIYYGNALAGGTDGFAGLNPYGNINSVPGILTTAPAEATVFDCTTTGFQANAQAASPTRVCYFPTSLRVGIDNDNIILTSAVVNNNYFQPPAGSTVASLPAVSAFAGTRVRVIKKGGGAPGSGPSQNTVGPQGLYQKGPTQTGLTAGNQFATTGTLRATGDYYDLFANTGGVALAAAAFPGNGAFSPYTVAPVTTGTVLSNGLTMTAFTGVFCEPARVRGRPAASYTNSMTPTAGNGGLGTTSLTSQNYLECTVDAPFFSSAATASNAVYVQPIEYVVVNNPFNQPANINGTFSYYPTLVGDGTLNSTTGMQAAIVAPFADPGTVPQANYLGTSPGPGGVAPRIYVGDNRPHEVVFREGHLYDARVARLPGAFNTDASALSSTVVYDIIQKLQAGLPGGSSLATAPNAPAWPPLPIMQANWTNTNAYAPMYEVPANVTTAGQTSPINTFNWLEKLFVSTTFPPLSASDPRVSTQQTVAAQNCVNYQTIPNITGGLVNATLAFPGLFDMRCGQDVYDTSVTHRDPITGQLSNFVPFTNVGVPGTTAATLIAPGIRGGASTDPNDGSMWNFGLYAQRRFGTIQGTGQLGSYIANYGLTFPATDPYGNGTSFFSDCSSPATCAFFTPIQIAGQQALIGPTNGQIGGPAGVNDAVSRQEMAKLVILSLMDEKAIAAFLNNTGGCTTTFSDVAPECSGGTSAPNVPPVPPSSVTVNGVTVSCGGNPTNAPAACFWRYIETMARRRITTGCIANDAIQSFCPNPAVAGAQGFLTRAQMAVFLIRAKMSNVFPSVISGCAVIQGPGCAGVAGGDNFGLTVPTGQYFADVPVTDPFYSYIQKMYELRISNGVAPVPAAPVYGRDQTLTRGQLIVFVVRAFFY